jgi:hypothetical protein
MWMSWGLLLFVLAFSVGCAAPEPPPEVTLIHATDPHLFEDPARLDAKLREFEEGLNVAALKAFLQAAGSLGDPQRRVVILTGDFGIDRSWTDQAKPESAKPGAAKNPPPKPPHVRVAQVKSLADVLKTGAAGDVYVVAGNNDLDKEIATVDALEDVAQYFQAVQKELAGTRVRLHDLTACYRAEGVAPASCVADIPGTAVRLVGFPSYSFKNSSPAVFDANGKVQQEHVQKFAALIAESREKGRKVVVLSHVPELDDPNTIARQRFANEPVAPHGNAERSKASTWNVKSEVFQEWKKSTEGPTVLAVLAGHFHDSHREIYRKPYRWSASASLRADPSKLFVAPPLAVKYQDTSPIQARGFSVLRLRGEELSQQLYWFNAETSAFEPEPLPSPPGVYPEPPFGLRWLWDPIVWLARVLSPTVLFLWNLGGDLKPLERMVVLAIAWLLAFLTVAKLWTVPKIPAELTGFSDVRTTPEASAEAAKALAAETPLTNNLGKTALSGLGGLAAISLLDNTFWEKGGSATKGYYVVWFVAMFSVLLVGFAILRGLVEGCRIRIASEHRPPEWRPRGGNECECMHHARYWGRRFWLWVLSWRPTLLVFFDTSLSVLLGDNVLRNAVLSDTIAKLQHSMILAIDRARDSITVTIRRALIDKGLGRDLDEGAVRVNVSVLAPDGGSAYYVSWAPGSLARVFDRNSVAWVAISAGEARWWRKTYENHELSRQIVVFNNVRARIPAREGLLRLHEFFQTRGAQDYEAFIVLPVPRRAASGDYWKAGIHISFSKEDYFTTLWPCLDPLSDQYDASPPDDYASPPEGELSKEALTAFYAAAPRVLEEKMLHSAELRAVLSESIDVVAEILRRFNAVVYETYVKPRILR